VIIRFFFIKEVLNSLLSLESNIKFSILTIDMTRINELTNRHIYAYIYIYIT